MTLALIAAALITMFLITNRVIPDLVRYIKIMRM